MTNREFFVNNTIFAENEQVILQKPEEEELMLYIRVLQDNGTGSNDVLNASYMEQVWQELNRESAFYCSVLRKSDGAFVGYVSIDDLNVDFWELTIEFLADYQRQGLGYQALSLFLHTIKEKTGITDFLSRVEGGNVGSQRLMEKLGGMIEGIHMEMSAGNRPQRVLDYRIVIA